MSKDRILSEEELEEAKEKAYNAGFEEGKEGGKVLNNEDISEPSEDIEESWETFIQYAEWSNKILPWLRDLAGFEDSGVGTYQEASSAEVEYNLKELIDKFKEGFFDGAEKEIQT